MIVGIIAIAVIVIAFVALYWVKNKRARPFTKNGWKMVGKTMTPPVPFDPLSGCNFFQAFLRGNGPDAQGLIQGLKQGDGFSTRHIVFVANPYQQQTIDDAVRCKASDQDLDRFPVDFGDTAVMPEDGWIRARSFPNPDGATIQYSRHWIYATKNAFSAEQATATADQLTALAQSLRTLVR